VDQSFCPLSMSESWVPGLVPDACPQRFVVSGCGHDFSCPFLGSEQALPRAVADTVLAHNHTLPVLSFPCFWLVTWSYLAHYP
jgi:hypothetical protein